MINKPSKKTKTVEVELMHEELIIENKAVQDKTSTTTPVTAAAISKGRTKPEDIISYTTRISAETGTVLNPKTEATITKDLDKDITTTNNEDASKLVSSGTSSTKSGGIDKADIYSSDDNSRHLEKVQGTQTTEKVEYKETTATES